MLGCSAPNERDPGSASIAASPKPNPAIVILHFGFTVTSLAITSTHGAKPVWRASSLSCAAVLSNSQNQAGVYPLAAGALSIPCNLWTLRTASSRGPKATFGLPIDNLSRDLQSVGPMPIYVTRHCQTGVRKAEPHESRVQWLGINRRNTEAIDAMPLSSRTRRNPKLLGGLPTAQPPPLASRTKSVT